MCGRSGVIALCILIASNVASRAEVVDLWSQWHLVHWLNNADVCNVSGTYNFSCKFDDDQHGGVPMSGIDFAIGFAKNLGSEIAFCVNPRGYDCKDVKKGEVDEPESTVTNGGDRKSGSGNPTINFVDGTSASCHYFYYVYADLGKAGGTVSCSYSGSKQQNQPEATSLNVIHFHIKNSTGINMQVDFHSQTFDRVWPGNNRAWDQNDDAVHDYNLSCSPGEKICYGAWSVPGHNTTWGTGFDGTVGCQNCCGTCGDNIVIPRLVD
jgi:hypothetical protein